MMELLDYRGCEVCLEAPEDCTVKILYLGAPEPGEEKVDHDEDPYTVPAVEDAEFRGTFRKVLRDPGITKSGLRVCFAAEQETAVKVRIAGDLEETLTAGPGRTAEAVFQVKDLCGKEKEYLAAAHDVLYRLIRETDRVCRKNGIPPRITEHDQFMRRRYRHESPAHQRQPAPKRKHIRGSGRSRKDFGDRGD